MSIANCGHDERGKYHGGAAGDQTGTEYYVRSWYNFGQNHVLRPPTTDIGNAVAKKSKAAADNPNIGYDQYDRASYPKALKAAGWDPAKIKVKCETDCSGSTIVAIIAVGHQLGIKELQSLSPDLYTGNIRKALVAAGWKDLTDKKYLSSDAYLLPGDLNLREGHHINVNLTKGSKAGDETYPKDAANQKQSKSAPYYPKYAGSSKKIDVVFAAIGVDEKYRGSWQKRKPVAVANSMIGYTGKESENLTLIELAKKGKLKK